MSIEIEIDVYTGMKGVTKPRPPGLGWPKKFSVLIIRNDNFKASREEVHRVLVDAAKEHKNQLN